MSKFYLLSVLDKINSENIDTIDARKRAENSFMVNQLVKMFSYLDFADMHGKYVLIE